MVTHLLTPAPFSRHWKYSIFRAKIGLSKRCGVVSQRAFKRVATRAATFKSADALNFQKKLAFILDPGYNMPGHRLQVRSATIQEWSSTISHFTVQFSSAPENRCCNASGR